ncbi:MAG: hypothetical protein ACOC9Q_01805 [bacterium]
MSVEVVRVRNAAAFDMKAIANLIRRSLASDSLVRNVNDAMDELQRFIDRDNLGLFIAREGRAWSGLLIASWSRSALSPGCTILHLHNEGGRETLDALVEQAIEYARDGGYDRVIGMDTNDRPRGFKRLFGRKFKNVQLSGEVHVFELEDET